MTPGIRVGVDIGGTFTDVVVRRPGSAAQILKIPTTRGDPSVAVLRAVEQLRQTQDIEASAIERFLHGTTVATNAVLERKGARVGLLSTAGFSDVLEIGRQMRHQMYDLTLDPETPVFLAPGRFRTEVKERIGSEGEVLTALDEASVARAADELAAVGCQAIAIAFLFSFLNDAHERRAREIVLARHPSCWSRYRARSIRPSANTSAPSSPRSMPTSSRWSTAIWPTWKPGLPRPASPRRCRSCSRAVAWRVPATARLRPVRLFLSGPAAGVIGGRMAAENSGIADVITVDIGGTSSDIALIEGGRPALKSEGTIERLSSARRHGRRQHDRLGRRLNRLDRQGRRTARRAASRRDRSRGLPATAVAASAPTVTDASVVLGYIDPDYFAGGAIKLSPRCRLSRDRADSRQAARLVGRGRRRSASIASSTPRWPRASDWCRSAKGMIRVASRLLPLGGAGPLHGCPLAEDLGIGRIIVPRLPGRVVGGRSAGCTNRARGLCSLPATAREAD